MNFRSIEQGPISPIRKPSIKSSSITLRLGQVLYDVPQDIFILVSVDWYAKTD